MPEQTNLSLYYEKMSRINDHLDDIEIRGPYGLHDFTMIQFKIDEAVELLLASIKDGSLASRSLYKI